MLEIRNLSAGYDGKTVLRDISLSIPQGAVTVIVGPNGCGKSTLLKALAGILPAAGSVALDGLELRNLDRRELAKLVAFLPQNRPTPEITAQNLVLHGRFPYLSYPRRYSKQDYRIAVQAIQQMGIGHLAEKRMKKLSGGMRQSAYIAMALAQNTDYILMDEPTTYLDIANQMQLMQILKQLASQGKGILLVLHDLIMALEMADRILVMQDGKVQMDADIDAIYTSGILEQVYQIRVQRTQDGHYYYC